LKEFQDAKKILFYSSFQSEVRTMEMIEEALAAGKEIILPITLFEDNALKLVEVTSTAGLVKNKAGIPEPVENGKKEVQPDELDLIVVPGSAFTEDGKRLGQGWGLFDRLFEKTKAVKVGLAFDMQVVKNLPMEKHDQLLDILVTESGIHRKIAP
ncbi:MAG: 5-formyltetrahydrofolate cyclo-ligase, partial [archaeon]